MKLVFPIGTLCALFCFAACTKEGEGGAASIRGYIHTSKLSSTFTQLLDQYPARDQDVYIVYGDRTWGFDDRTRTDYQGRFSFDLLYPGNYTVYTYSKDSSRQDLSGITAVVRTVEIQKRKDVVTLDTMHIIN